MSASRPATVSARLSWTNDALNAAATLSVANRVGVLQALESGDVGADQVAADIGADPRHVTTLLDALTAMGLAESTNDDRFRATVPNLSVLAGAGPNADLLDHVVRTGHAPLRCDEPDGAKSTYPAAVGYLAALFEESAAAAALVVGNASRVLDVGAGAAPWSVAIAQRNPRCRVTALDLDDVLEVTRRVVAAAGSADRFDFLPGDMFEAAVSPATYDLVLVANVCHLFDGPTVAGLFRRLRPAIKEDGRIAVVDVMPSPDPMVERSVRLYAVGLMTRTATGGVHTTECYRVWLEEAGYRFLGRHDVSGLPPVSVVIGESSPAALRTA